MSALVLVLAAMTIPQLLAGVDRMRGLAAARYLAARLALVRSQAVTRGATTALRFEQTNDGVVFAVFVDGNGNGIRTRDIENGIDWMQEAPMRLGDLFPGVAIDLAPDGGGTTAVQLGRSSILSFTPMGTATSGTIHILGADGTQWGVRVLGATGRTRVLRYVPASSQWVDAF